MPARRGLAATSPSVWGMLRHELLFLAYALLEIALITPVVLVILNWARYWPALYVALWLLLLMLLPLNIIRLLGLLQWDVKRQRRVLVAAMLLTLLFSWRLLLYEPASLFDLSWLRRFLGSFAEGGNLLWTRDLSVFLIVILIWWRGIRLAIRHPEINNMGLRLRVGGLILLPLIVWFGSSFLDVNMVPFVLLFFLAGLTAVSLVRAENIEQERTGTAASLDGRWFVGVLAAAAGVVLAAGVAAAFIAGDSLFVVLAWLSPLWQALQFGGTVAGVTLFQLIYPAFELLAVVAQYAASILLTLLRLISGAIIIPNTSQQAPLPELPTPTPTAESLAVELGGKALTVGIMLGLVVLVALALARAYQQATFAARESDRSSRSAEDEEPGLGRRMLERLGLLRQWRAAASVRRIYRQMCRAAGEAGYPRLGAETPYEYLPSLGRVWPDHVAETRAITEAFIRVRYGEFPETEEELEVIRAAWQRLAAADPQRRETTAEAGVKLTKRE